MKKALFVVAFVIAALVVNGQAKDTTTMQKKSTTTTKATTTTVTNEKSIRTAVKVTELQKSITDNIAKDYAGYTIKGATSVTLNNNVTYEVVIVKGTATETLVYDKDGMFVKKLPQNAVKPAPKKK
jgi:mannitol-specific phosphotransferase system IIBC component